MPKKGGGGKKKSADSSRKVSKSSKKSSNEDDDGSVYMGKTQYNPAITEMLRSTAQDVMTQKQKCPPGNPMCRSGKAREPPEPKGAIKSVEILKPEDLKPPEGSAGAYECPKSCPKRGG